jgi:hypothetical protein
VTKVKPLSSSFLPGGVAGDTGLCVIDTLVWVIDTSASPCLGARVPALSALLLGGGVGVGVGVGVDG